MLLLSSNDKPEYLTFSKNLSPNLFVDLSKQIFISDLKKGLFSCVVGVSVEWTSVLLSRCRFFVRFCCWGRDCLAFMKTLGDTM